MRSNLGQNGLRDLHFEVKMEPKWVPKVSSGTPWTPLGRFGDHVGSFGGFWVALWSSWGALGSSSGRFWEHFGSIFDGFWSVFWISSETNYEALFSWFSDNFLLFFYTLPKMRRSLPLEKTQCICNFFVSFSRR